MHSVHIEPWWELCYITFWIGPYSAITSIFKEKYVLRKALTFLKKNPDWTRHPPAPDTHTEIQGRGPTRANRCHTCARTYDPLTYTLTQRCTSLKFQSARSSSLTVEKRIWTFWQCVWSRTVTQYISHHLTEGLVWLYVQDTLLLRVIMCHTSLFWGGYFWTTKIAWWGELAVIFRKTLTGEMWRCRHIVLWHMIVIRNALQNNRTAQGGTKQMCEFAACVSLHVCVWVCRHNQRPVICCDI